MTNAAGTLSVSWLKGSGYTGTYPTDFVVETSDKLVGGRAYQPKWRQALDLVKRTSALTGRFHTRVVWTWVEKEDGPPRGRRKSWGWLNIRYVCGKAGATTWR